MTARLLLQRRLPGDAGRWRTVVRFGPQHADTVQRAAEALAAVDAVEWRVAPDAPGPAVVVLGPEGWVTP